MRTNGFADRACLNGNSDGSSNIGHIGDVRDPAGKTFGMRTLFAFALLGIGGIAHAQISAGWVQHRNDKYGFSLEYPGDIFKLERTTETGDGHAFVSEDGKARLLVGALENTSRFTTAAYQNHVAQQAYGTFKVTDRPISKSWFSLSGESNEEIFYEKVIFSCAGRMISSFAMIYSIERRDEFDPLVERIEESFRAGASCERFNSPRIKRERRSPDAGRPREQLAAGSRSRAHSSLQQPDRGSWVIRGRGRPGYVILQRTSPPYERKVVPGQAF